MALSNAPIAIVGGGITGMAAALRLQEHLPPAQFVLIERDARLGGKIQTERTQGFVIEAGPDSFLTAKPGAVELCARLGISDRLVGTLPAEHRSYVRRRGRLHELPDGISGLIPSKIGPLLSTSLLSLRGRARAGLDLVIPRRSGDGEESIAGFVRRRLGGEAYDWLVEPLLSGIYAGDGSALSLDATFPQLREVERAHGSLIRGMLQRKGGARPAGSPFLSPARGMSEIVEALEARLASVRVIRGVEVTSLEPLPDGWALRLSDGDSFRARGVILAIPASAAARLVAAFDGALGPELESFPAVSVATVALAYPDKALSGPLKGYGYLRPRAEGGPIVACTWVSSKWPGRAPEGFVLIRAFVGRAGVEDAVSLSDRDLLGLVQGELHEVLGTNDAPALSRIHRWPRGMPQYTLGHSARLAEVEHRLALYPGLQVAGQSYHGIGIPDCIRSGERAADRLLAQKPVVTA